MRRIHAALAVLVCAHLGYGCDSEPKGGAPAPTATAASAPTATATAAATTQATAAVTAAPTAAASAATSAAAAPAKLPPGRTPMPTLDEWTNQTQEVTVKGSSALGCETKIVREYLRVSCAGKNDTGGTPTAVQVTRGGRGEALAFASGGATTLIVPFVKGVDLAATFSWTDKSHNLVVKWPNNAPKPLVYGVFEGAASPLSSEASAASEKLCSCHKQVMKAANCDALVGAPSPDCERTYTDNCEKLLACSRGDQSALPKCMPGYVNAYFGRCFRVCGDGKPDCPPTMTCETGEYSICVEQ